MSRLVLIRHGRPEVAVGIAPASWSLSPQSYADVEQLSALLWPLNDPIVVASTEPKATQTAEALALAPVRTMSDFNEVQKPWHDDPADHRAATSKYLAGEPVSGWEPLEEAVERFATGVRRVAGSRDLVIATHGTVMSAWLSASRLIGEPFEFWTALRLPDAWEVDLDAGDVRRVGPPPDHA